MVTRSLVVVNSALMSSGDGEGSGGAAALGSSGSSANTPQNNDDDEDEYRDVLQTARNVLGSSSTLHRAHTSYELLADSARNNDGNDDDDDDGDEESNEEQNESHNDRETTSSTDAQQHQPAYAYHEPLQPQSPMVTPPTRNYQRATVEASLAAATKPADRSALYDTYQQSAGVPHVYHDHSQVPDDSSFIRKKTGGVTQPFPEKLHEMLHAVAQTEASDIVSWLPHGRAFIVRKPKEFTEVLMPKYFKQTKLTSFQRQLNLYGFRRLTQGADAGAYYHELFLRARPGLTQRMARQKVKGTGHKQPADAKTEPDFYQMRPADDAAAVVVAAGMSFGAVLDVGGGSSSQSLSQSSLSLFQDMTATAAADPSMATTAASMAVQDGPGSYPSPAWTFRQAPPGSVLDSPASPGLHGAAHLLQNIASGYTTTAPSLRMPHEDASLGPPAVGSSSFNSNDGRGDEPSSSAGSPSERRPATSFLQPRLSSPFDFQKS